MHYVLQRTMTQGTAPKPAARCCCLRYYRLPCLPSSAVSSSWPSHAPRAKGTQSPRLLCGALPPLLLAKSAAPLLELVLVHLEPLPSAHKRRKTLAPAVSEHVHAPACASPKRATWKHKEDRLLAGVWQASSTCVPCCTPLLLLCLLTVAVGIC
eukprot:scaffold952_cov409-Prasinococcus_capsulatus_cf.AAC.6